MTYLDLFKEQVDLKESVVKEGIPKEEIVSFSGIDLHEDMDFSFFSNEKIVLAHSCIHTIFSKKNKFIDKNRSVKLHSKIVEEMRKRGLKHPLFDKLDRKEDKI